MELYVEPEDIQRLEEKYNGELLSGRGLSTATKFEYAWALVQSCYRNDTEKGLDILTSLLRESPENRDYLYYAALGHYRRHVEASQSGDSLFLCPPTLISFRMDEQGQLH